MKPLHLLRVASVVLALSCAWLSPAANAQQIATVPAFIDLDEAQLQTPAGARLAETQDRFRNALDGDPERAIALAKDIVGQTAELFGGDHANVSVALTNLAILQAEDRDYGAAIENYQSAITVMERAKGSVTAPELADPLHGLANAYMETGDVEGAIPLYERAVLISHVNEGPANLDQIPTAAALSRAWLVLGKAKRATQIQEQIYRLQQRNLGETSDGYVEALMQRAQWYEGVRDYYAAAKSYRRAASSLETAHGESDPRLIEPLVAFAFAAPQSATSPWSQRDRSGRNLTFIILEARRAVDKAVRVARAHSGDDPSLLPLTLVAQGDWAMLMGRRNLAWRAYREAWALLDGNPALHTVRDELFAQPTLLTGVGFDRVYSSGLLGGRSEQVFPELGFVELSYNVSVGGRPVNIEIVDSTPAGLLDGQVYRGMPNFVFRPAFRDGRPFKYTGMTYRHQFRYDPGALTERERDFVERTRRERTVASSKGSIGSG